MDGKGELYEFHVRADLSDTMLEAFAGLQATKNKGETVLTGELLDQAALFGILDRIEALGIQLIEVRRARPGTESENVSISPDS